MGRGSNAESILYGTTDSRGAQEVVIGSSEYFFLDATRPVTNGIDGRVTQKVMAKLMVNADEAPDRPSYKAFLPQAYKQKRSIFSLLADASKDQNGQILKAKTPGEELNWLATQLRVSGNTGLAKWDKEWERAVELSNVDEEPQELGLNAKRLLLKGLAESLQIGRDRFTTEVLAEAIEYDARCVHTIV